MIKRRQAEYGAVNDFTKATFIETDEIEPFFINLGFEKMTVFGQEGIVAPRQRTINTRHEEVRSFYLDLSLRLFEKRKYFPYSNHIMYVRKAH